MIAEILLLSKFHLQKPNSKTWVSSKLKVTLSKYHAVNTYPFSFNSNNPPMGLLPDTQNCGCACAGNAGNVFPVTAGKRSRHASRHVRHARAVMHAGIANLRFPFQLAAGENVPGIPGACATCNFMYLVRGPCLKYSYFEYWTHVLTNIMAMSWMRSSLHCGSNIL